MGAGLTGRHGAGHGDMADLRDDVADRLAGCGGQAVGMVEGNQMETAWVGVKKRLRLELGDSTYQSWIAPLAVGDLVDGELVLYVPTPFFGDHVRSHFLDRLTALWRAEHPTVRRVAMRVRPRPATARQSAPVAAVVPDAPPKAVPAARAAVARAAEKDIAGVGAPLDNRFTFDNFVVGKSNELAYAAARRVSESAAVNFNPLFLYGGVGLGKTHLMHAIAWGICERDPNRRVIYLSAEKFMYQFVRAIRHNDQMAFKEQFRSVDVLMIDDVQFISGKNSTQEEFFHTFNALVDHNRQIIISADRSPTDLEGIEERIRSRLGWGLVADIHPTDYELRLGILQSKIEGLRKVDVPKRVVEFLAARITSNVRELEGALNRVAAFAELVGRPISVEMAQEVLQDLLRANDRRITIDDIQRRVAEFYGVRMNEMLSARRARVVARPRQVAMYLAKQLTSRSLPEIGRKFGGRDHTTVIHAVRKVEELCGADSAFHEEIDSLKRMLET